MTYQEFKTQYVALMRKIKACKPWTVQSGRLWAEMDELKYRWKNRRLNS